MRLFRNTTNVDEPTPQRWRGTTGAKALAEKPGAQATLVKGKLRECASGVATYPSHGEVAIAQYEGAAPRLAHPSTDGIWQSSTAALALSPPHLSLGDFRKHHPRANEPMSTWKL
jgi:hypothetical protein